jgi:hypothetical protein
MEYDPKYTIVVMNKKFVLTKSQIEFDSPNYFTTCFLGDYREAQTRQIELSRDPSLFAIIVKYLCGYSVLPLNEKQIPPDMSPTSALVNLRVDAAFYQLDGLIRACDKLLSVEKLTERRSHMALLGLVQVRDTAGDTGNVYQTVPCAIANHHYNTTVPQIFINALDSYHTVGVPPDQLSKEPFSELIRPDAADGPTGFGGLRTMGAVESVLRLKLGTNYFKEWSLVGYRIETDLGFQGFGSSGIRTYKLVILVKRILASPLDS